MMDKPFFQSPKPHLFAHRGGNAAGAAKENTALAFQSAVNLGCSYLETDVVVTKDLEVVTYHGSRTNAEAKRTGLATRDYAQSLTYEELQKEVQPGGEAVPQLKDVLISFPAAKFSIDLKTNEVIVPFVKIIQQTQSIDRVCVASFSLRRLLKAANLLGGAKQVALAYCIHPRLRGFVRAFPGVLFSRLANKGIDCIHIHHKTVNDRIVKVAHSQGIVVYVWTVNTETDFRKCIDMGVDGIISDETKLLSIRKM